MSRYIGAPMDKYIETLSTWCHAVNNYIEQMQGGPSRVTNDNRKLIDLAVKNRDVNYLKGIRKEDKAIIREFAEWDFAPLDYQLKKEIGVGLDWSD